MNMQNAPKAKKLLPMMGMIQWTFGRALQPNQKRQMGIQNAPTKAGSSRSSGTSSSFSLNFGS